MEYSAISLSPAHKGAVAIITTKIIHEPVMNGRCALNLTIMGMGEGEPKTHTITMVNELIPLRSALSRLVIRALSRTPAKIRQRVFEECRDAMDLCAVGAKKEAGDPIVNVLASGSMPEFPADRLGWLWSMNASEGDEVFVYGTDPNVQVSVCYLGGGLYGGCIMTQTTSYRCTFGRFGVTDTVKSWPEQVIDWTAKRIDPRDAWIVGFMFDFGRGAARGQRGV